MFRARALSLLCAASRRSSAVCAAPGDGIATTSGDSGMFRLGLAAAAALGAIGAAEQAAFCEPSENLSPRRSKYLMKDSYRRRVFFKYERRVRAFSPPEKVFEYFASLTEDGESFMTPADLMRAAVAVFPPSESSFVREGFLLGERSPGDLQFVPSKFFMLFDTNGDGRVSFAEYIFFITLLSIPEENFSTTFKMFDIDGSGMIDREEFKKIMGVMRSQTRQGMAQRGGRRSISMRSADSVENGGLVQLFFGEDGNKLLSFDEFVSFLRDLHREMARLEFSHYDYQQNSSISARDFALSLVAAADLSRINQYLDLADALAEEPAFKGARITFEEFLHFSELRKKLPTLALAISSYGKTYGLLTKSDLQRAAAQVCNVPLTDAVVDIVFYIFDLNRDGNLSMEEFLGALQRREHDIAHPADMGIVHLLKCWWSCARDCQSVKYWMHI